MFEQIFQPGMLELFAIGILETIYMVLGSAAVTRFTSFTLR